MNALKAKGNLKNLKTVKHSKLKAQIERMADSRDAFFKKTRKAYLLDGAKTERTSHDLDAAMRKNENIDATDAPWIRVHESLFASATETGSTTYRPLIKHLYEKEGKKDFVIFSGRHGDVLNIVDQDKKCPKYIFDDRQLDKESELQSWKDSMKIKANIKVVDTAKLDGKDSTQNHREKLKAYTEKELRKGKVVIYAWCYSIYAQHPEIERSDLDEEGIIPIDDPTIRKLVKEASNEKVCDIVKHRFDFADPAAWETSSESSEPPSVSVSPAPSLSGSEPSSPSGGAESR